MAKPPSTPKAPSRRRCQIVLNAPEAQFVAVTGDFCDWAADGRPLRRGDNGTWTAILLLPPGRYEYRFLVDGQWADDPACPDRVPNPFGTQNCVLLVEPAAAKTGARAA